MRQGILVMTSGPALSGKSTFIGGLKKNSSFFTIVSTDNIRFELYGNYDFDPKRESTIWSTTYQRTEEFLKKGYIVCLDATFRTPEYRGMVINRFKGFPIIYFAFEKPSLDILLQRNDKRVWKQFAPEVVKMMYDDYQFPSESEKTYYYKVFDVNQENFHDMIEIGGQYLNELHGS
jgi:predicted kinase